MHNDIYIYDNNNKIDYNIIYPKKDVCFIYFIIYYTQLLTAAYDYMCVIYYNNNRYERLSTFKLLYYNIIVF